MENKNTSTHLSQLLAYLNAQHKVCFNFKDAFKALPNLKEDTIKKWLKEMSKQAFIMRLKEGVYYIIPRAQNAKTFKPNRHTIADNIVKANEHYIGYYSALQIHNLVTQPHLKEQIVVSTQIKPAEVQITDVIFQFIYHNEKHFFGYKKIALDDLNKVVCSDLEKTIIDCLFKPHYAGGIVEIAKAIYSAKDKIKFNTLLKYAKKFNSYAVIKRLGFILETLEINTDIIEKLNKLTPISFGLLNSAVPKTATFISRWGIEQNVETETLKQIIKEGLKKKNTKIKKK